MSRRHKKKPARPAPSKPDGKAENRLPWQTLAVVFCLLPAAFFFAFGKYLEFGQPDPFDSGAYVYSAKHLLDGARLGIDEIPSAQPGTLIINLLGVLCFGFNETGPIIIQMLMQLGALTALFFALRNLLGKTAAVFSVSAAAIYLSAPHIAKFGNTKEQYMIAFMMLAVSFWIFYERTGKKRWLLLMGAALLWPFYFKATGLSVDIAFGLYFLGRGIAGGISRKQFQQELLLLIGGALIGSLPLAAYFLWQRQPGALLDSFPFLILKVILVLDVLGLGLVSLMKFHPVAHLRAWGRQVRPVFWITGLAAIALMLAGSCLYVYSYSSDDVGSYLNNLFFVRIYHGIAWRLSDFYRAVLTAAGADSAYISGARRLVSLSKQAPIVLRYYWSLNLPVISALLSGVLAAGITLYRKRVKKLPLRLQDRLVWLLIPWWLLDMVFVWISPHSYEQYYLPLCGSGAVLGGYAVWLFVSRMQNSPFKGPYILGAAAGVGVMVWMVWPLVFGYRKSAYNGTLYTNPPRQRGYVQSLERIRAGQGRWQVIGDYIRQHSDKTDRIYVWGWYPGIYVQAQRMTVVPKAIVGEMHTLPPEMLAGLVQYLIGKFEENPPRFIVDTRKPHFPFDRPPLELWPILSKESPLSDQQGYLLNQPDFISYYEKGYAEILREKVGNDEALRFEAMKPLRDYIMAHYRIVKELSSPRSHVLFERK